MRRLILAAVVSLSAGLAGGAENKRVVRLDLLKHVPAEKAAHIERVGSAEWEWHLPTGEREALTLDLGALGVDPKAYDEIRFDIKPLVSEVNLRVTLHGHLEPGQVSRWYLKTKSATGVWTPVRFEVDLDDDGAYCRPREVDGPPRTLELEMSKRMLGYPGEPKWRKARIRNLRLVRRMVEADFKLLETVIDKDGGDVAYTYKLHVANRTDAPVEARIDPDPDGRLHYVRAEAPGGVALDPGETKTVPVRLAIDRTKALALPPLYAEGCVPRVSVPGADDSDVLPLRGYRSFPMWAAVPMFERARWSPAAFQAALDARAKALPAIAEWRKRTLRAADAALPHDYPVPDYGPPGHDQGYRCSKCKCWLKPAGPTTLHKHVCPECGKVWENNEKFDAAYLKRYHGRRARNVRDLAVAWLLTGKDAYAEKAAEILDDYARIYPDMPILSPRSTSSGSRLGRSTLHSSYTLPVFAEGYDYLYAADCLDAERRERIEGFLRQAAVEICQHCVGYNNQQAEHFRAYGTVGIATGFWPLAAEAIHGEVGWHELVEYNYSEDGIAHEGAAYHRSSFKAMNEFAIAAWGAGVDLYTARFKRVFDGSIAAGLANTSYELAYRVWRDPAYLPRVDRKNRGRSEVAALHGVLGLPDAADLPVRSTLMPGAGYVFLKRGNAADNTEIRLNYIKQFDRHEHDRLTAFLYRNGRQVDGTVGRITYGSKHCPWMTKTAAHNCIVIDGNSSRTAPSDLLVFDDSAEATLAMVATSEKTPLYDGVRMVRCIALIDGAYVVFDRVVCDRPRTIDRYQWGRGSAKLTPSTKPVEPPPADLPERGAFSNIEAADAGRELKAAFANGLKMRLLSDGDMRAVKAVSVGGYQARPMEVTFARRPAAKEAHFLAVFAFGPDAECPPAKLVKTGEEEIVFDVGDTRFTLNPPAKKVQVSSRAGG